MPASSTTCAPSASARKRSHRTLIDDFFAAYARRLNEALSGGKADVAATRAAFADYFVGADPNGVRGGRDGLLFRLMIPRGLAYYRRIGTIAMDATGLRVTELDPWHVMAHVDWLARYRSGEIAFTNIYLLQVRDGAPKIFSWITGDEQKALKDAGVID